MTELLLAPYDTDRVLLFNHIRKTAGTSLRTVIRRVHEKKGGSDRTLDPFGRPEEIKQLHHDWWNLIGPKRRSKVWAIVGHEAAVLLPILDRPVFAVTIVRDPVERVISAWAFRNRPNRERNMNRLINSGTIDELYERAAGGDPRDFVRTDADLFNGQARALLAPHWDVDTLPFTDEPSLIWRERLHDALNDYALVGTQERFRDFLYALSEEMGWGKVKEPHKKVNSAKPSAIDASTRQEILRYNWLDQELYELCSARSLDVAQAITTA